MRTKGWQKVFGFTLIQYIKTKSFIIGTIIMCLIVVLLVVGLNIIPKLMGGTENILGGLIGGQNISLLGDLCIIDNSGILTQEDLDVLTEEGSSVSRAEEERDAIIARLAQSDRGKALIIISDIVSEEEVVGYDIKTYYSPGSDGAAVDAATAAVSQLVTFRNMSNLGVSPENFAASQRFITTSKITAGDDEWNMFESMINYVVPMVVSLLLFILIFAYGQTVAQSIATEKTSRVMELLLTSVRPLAVVIGKVLAMGLVSLLQFMLIGTVGAISFAISAPFGIGGDLMTMIDTADIQVGENAEIVEAFNNTLGNFSVIHVILILVIFMLGFIFFSLIAALVGASVSRMEDLAQAMQPYSLLGVLGFYLAYFPVIFNMESLETGAASSNPVQLFSYYFPISSPFSLPSALLLGSLSLGEVVIAVVILAAFVVLIAMLVAKVYEMIILHSGSRLKMGDILKLAGIGKK